MLKWLLAIMVILSVPVCAQTPMEAFEQCWQTARDNLSPITLSQRFTEAEHQLLATQASLAHTPADVADLLNPFLDTLHVSHTHLYTTADLEYYLFRSMFTTRRIDRPVVSHIGAQFVREGDIWHVRSVLDGYPAMQVGLRRGDVVVEADGQPFQPVQSFAAAQPVRLTVQRGGQAFEVTVTPVVESFHLSLLRAMQRSVRVLHPWGAHGRSIGYIHLWSGTSDKILEAYTAALAGPLSHTDGLILDLRDGYGGAWYEYLDPFFADRTGFFVSTQLNRDGSRSVATPDPVPAHPWYRGPIVALIDDGVRSGKESVAYQLKKSHRATLVGDTTAGAFMAGRAFFSDRPGDYILYVAVYGILLDDAVIEGRGVTPDVAVPYSWRDPPPPADPQFGAALRVLRQAQPK